MSVARKNRRPKYVYHAIPNENPLLLDIPRAAGLLCTTVWAVRNLVWSGQVKATKLGRKWVISRAELERFVASRQEVA